MSTPDYSKIIDSLNIVSLSFERFASSVLSVSGSLRRFNKKLKRTNIATIRSWTNTKNQPKRKHGRPRGR